MAQTQIVKVPSKPRPPSTPLDMRTPSGKKMPFYRNHPRARCV